MKMIGALLLVSVLCFAGFTSWARPVADSDRIDLKIWYESYNEDYFLSALPKDTVLNYGNIWPNMGLTTHENGAYRISIDADSNKAVRVAQMTLLHEMCHVAQWGHEDMNPHGPKFQACMHRLADEGAFDQLW